MGTKGIWRVISMRREAGVRNATCEGGETYGQIKRSVRPRSASFWGGFVHTGEIGEKFDGYKGLFI